MLKNWLDKLKNMIQMEVDIETEETPVKRQPVKAKITYRYPENRTFPFPAIPDERKPKMDDKDIPAYLRRNEKEERKKTDRVPENKRKVYKPDNAPPFKPTKVPSPIYGFQKRPKRGKEAEDVPAYIRKKQEQTKLQAEAERNEEIEQLEQTPAFGEQVVTETAATTEETIEKEKETVASVESSPPKDRIKTIQQLAEEEKSEPRRKRPMKKHSKKRRKAEEQQPIPYNVIMTPWDKQKMRRQDKRQETATKAGTQQKPASQTEEKSKRTTKIPLYLLNDTEAHGGADEQWIKNQQMLLEQTLKHFHVAARVVNATQGPAVTRFEVQPELGVKVSKIRNLSDDLKLNMAAKDIRIEAPIPGKNTVGIEVPNPEPQTVGLLEILETEEFNKSKSPMTIALGLTIEGKPKITDIQKMPHGLIAGATGSGKSVCINAILVSILYKAHHEDVKFLLIDPKMVELAPYNGIPHLVAPVITDVKAATQSLKWAVEEMESRYERFVEEGVRDIARYNRKVLSQARDEDKMPYIVIVIDELADLMMVSPQDVEHAISRIAQKARACGIHLLLATQRPSVDVITGLIKANIPTRIAFSVSSQVDSRTILDSGGAEKLLGKGDMLFLENGTSQSVRLQGPFVSDEEIERVTAYARDIAEPEYLFEQEQLLEQIELEEEEDELMEDAIRFVVEQQSASTSMLQRHFKIGYNRAARLMDAMEARGIISGQNGSKPRDVLISDLNVDNS